MITIHQRQKIDEFKLKIAKHLNRDVSYVRLEPDDWPDWGEKIRQAKEKFGMKMDKDEKEAKEYVVLPQNCVKCGAFTSPYFFSFETKLCDRCCGKMKNE